MDRLGAALGTDGGGAQKAVDAATPAIVAGAADRIERPGGVDALSKMMQNASASPQSGVEGMLAGTPELGSGMLSGLFGNNSAGLATQLAGTTGLGASAIGKLLPMLAPVVMGAVAKHQAADGLDGVGLTNLLWSEKAELERDGFLAGGEPGGVLGTATGALKESTRTVTAPAAAAAGGGGGMRWLWWGLGALAFVAIAAWALSQCGGSDDVTGAVDGAVEGAVDGAEDSAEGVVEEVDDATNGSDATDDAEATDDAGSTDGANDGSDAGDSTAIDLQPAVDDALAGVGISGIAATVGDDGIVSLTGSVDSDETKAAAEAAVTSVDGVVGVDNQLEVAAGADEESDEETADDEPADDSADDSGDDSAAEAPSSGAEIGDILNLDPITFAVNSAEITRDGRAVLDEAVAYMTGLPDVKVEIGGHTDSDGDDASNLTLSQARADSVKAYMESEGVEADRMTAVGYGEAEPKTDNDTPENKATNRRIEFVVE